MRRDDWLAHQLPVGMTDDDFLMRFLGIFQTVSDTVLHHVDTLPHVFDPTVAPDGMVRLMGHWLGLDVIDPSLDDALQRRMVMEYSQLLRWRGTARGLQRLLEVVTGGAVTVDDNGGVYPEGEAPRTAPHVTIRVEGTGWTTEDDLVDIVRGELPASVTFELVIGDDRVWPLAPEPVLLAVGALPEAAAVQATRSDAAEPDLADILGPGALPSSRPDGTPPDAGDVAGGGTGDDPPGPDHERDES